MEIDKELLKTDKLYNIIVDQRMLDLLLKFEKRVEANYDYKENTRGVREEIDPDLDNDKCKDVVRWNVLQRLNGSLSKTANPSLDQFRRGLALHMDKRLMENILRGNCLSNDLLIRTQQWKDDGAFLVRDLQILENVFTIFHQAVILFILILSGLLTILLNSIVLFVGLTSTKSDFWLLISDDIIIHRLERCIPYLK